MIDLRSRSLLAAAVFGAACGLAEPTQGTTRICPVEDGDELCFQQCGDPAAPACSVVDQTGAAVVECARDGVTTAYLRMDDAYVLPAGQARCFVILADQGDTPDPFDDAPSACDAFGILVVDPAGHADDACFDFTCAVTGEDC
jgi:hypothetical protein